MAKARIHRPLAILRGLFLILMVGAVGGIGWLFLRSGDEPTAPPRDRPSGVSDDDRGVISVGQGFQYDVTEEGRRLFEIEATRIVSDRQDRFVLDDVRLSVAREDGGAYAVSSRKGTYELGTQGALLEGGVVLDSGDGLELRGEGFELRQQGRILVNTASPVRFRLPGGHSGEAGELWMNLKRKVVVLSGGVNLGGGAEDEATIELTGRRLAVDRGDGTIRVEGDVVFQRGEDRLRAKRVSVQMSPDRKGIRFVRGIWQVSGSVGAGDDSALTSRLDFTAESFVLAYDGAGREARKAELVGAGGEPAVLHWSDGTGRRRTLHSAKLLIALSGGTVRRIESPTAVTLVETLQGKPKSPLSRLCGDALVAAFAAGGDLETIEVTGAVSLQREGISALAARLEAVEGGDRLDLTGAPALLASGNGELTAPKITYSGATGAVEAKGGVRAAYRDASAIDFSVGAGAAAPVRIEAAEASRAGADAPIEFTGGVRAWQGDNFLLAETLRGSAGGDRLQALGGVKTVWEQTRDDTAEPAPEGPRPPIEINAESFEYLEARRLMSYRRNVRVQEGARRMNCTDLDVLLGEGKKMERLDCTGRVILDDPRTGRRVQASEAIYVPGDTKMRLAGDPVVLRDRDGAQIRGQRLLYDLETGQAQILSAPRVEDTPPTETQDADPGSD